MSLVEELLLDLQTSKGESESKVNQKSLFESEDHRNYLEGIIARGQKAKLLAWEVENFAQYEKERFEYGSHWVLLLKAFNSTGKSNALKALEYNLTTKGIGLQLAKGFIKHGALEAKITTFWSDGLEVEYFLTRTSLGARSVFKNGYRVYLVEDGERTEVYNTLVDGRFVKIGETPSFLKRYFNLAEVNGRYLNLLRGSEGLPVLDQSPASLNKMLAQATDLETAEQALKRMADDNKQTFQELENVESRIRIHSQDIVERRHLTKSVLEKLEEATTQYNQVEQGFGCLQDMGIDLKAMSDLQGTVTVDLIDSRDLTQLVLIANKLKDLSEDSLFPTVDLVTSKDLRSLDIISKQLEDLSTMVVVGDAPSVGDLRELKVISTLDSFLSSLESMESVGSVSLSKTEDIRSILTLNSLFSELESLEKSLELEEDSKSRCFEESEKLLASLKEQGYPVGICSHCGHLSITEPFEIGSTLVSPHEHS